MKERVLKAEWGFTLLEMMIVVALMAIMALVALPMIDNARRMLEQRNAMRMVQLSLIEARTQAMITKQAHTWCVSDGERCQLQGQTLIVFIDDNKDAVVNGSEQVVHYSYLNLRYGQLKLAASAKRRYIKFNGHGANVGFIGHISYCSDKGGGARVVLNMSGGMRVVGRC